MEPSSPRSYLASRPTSRWLVTKTSWKVVKESLVRLIPAATDLVEFVGQPLEQSCSEEAFDAGLFCRGLFAECKGFEVLKGDASYVGEVPLGLVSDAKDVFDKSVSDTPTYGSQKSLAFSVAWIREVLRKDRTRIHWTSTENMLIDCGSKEMNPQHLKAVLSKGSWSITYNPSYVKQTTKPAKPKLAHVQSSTLPGRVLSGDDPILSHLLKLAERPGWHIQGPYGIHVCKNARSFRTPAPRFSKEQYPIRTSYGRFDTERQAEWRILEDRVTHHGKLDPIGDTASLLVTVFSPPLKTHERKESTENAPVLLSWTDDM